MMYAQEDVELNVLCLEKQDIVRLKEGGGGWRY
jgi:hypothetical protein